MTLGGLALDGVSTLAFLGNGIALNQPETGCAHHRVRARRHAGPQHRRAARDRPRSRSAAAPRHEHRDSAAASRRAATSSCSLAGAPMFRRYDAKGALLFERVMQGRELDPIIEQMPKTWPRRTIDGKELPLVVPTVRAAARRLRRQPVGVVPDAGHLRLRRTRARRSGPCSFVQPESSPPTSLFFSRPAARSWSHRGVTSSRCGEERLAIPPSERDRSAGFPSEYRRVPTVFA